MRIGSMNGVNTQPAATGAGQVKDSYSKNLENQIKNAQQRLQELSANTELSPEEKMKKRQEIMKEINDLQNQLRQHEIELRKEAQQQKENEKSDYATADKQQTEREKADAGLSGKSMEALLSVDGSMKQAQVYGSVKTEMEGRAGVLKAEIKQDAGREQDTSAKEAELADVERTAAKVGDAQIGTLAEAGKKLQEASKEDRENKKDTEGQIAAGQDAEKTSVAGKAADVTDGKAEEAGVQDEKEEADEKEAMTAQQRAAQIYYAPIDIKL